MDSVKKALTVAVIRMLNPLVRILLRHDISHSEFSELAKRSYVDVAYKHFSIPNRKKTYSRVSVITGLSRKEVVRIAQLEHDDDVSTKGPVNRATRVINGWLTDPEFLDKNNVPKQLTIRDKNGSFEQLASRYSGDITGRAVLDELLRVGAVIKVDKQTVKLANYGFVPNKSEHAKINIMSICASDLLATAIHNLDNDEQHPWFQRQVAYSKMSQKVADEFVEYAHQRSIDLLLEFDQWLAHKKKTTKLKKDEPSKRIGLGIYYIESENEEE